MTKRKGILDVEVGTLVLTNKNNFYRKKYKFYAS